MARIYTLSVVLLVLLACSEADKPVHSQFRSVLFVGNSLVYYNDLPSLFSAYAKSQQSATIFATELLAEAGYTLSQHLEAEAYAQELDSRKYAFVVLQEVGGWPLCPASHTECAKTEESLKMMSELAAESGAKPLWLGTWHPSPEVQIHLSSVTSKMGERTRIETMDAGAALHALSSNGNFDKLLLPDFHPDLLGSWLIAAIIYGTIAGEKLTPIESSLEYCHYDWKGSGISGLSAASAQGKPEVVCRELRTVDYALITDAANRALGFEF